MIVYNSSCKIIRSTWTRIDSALWRSFLREDQPYPRYSESSDFLNETMRVRHSSYKRFRMTWSCAVTTLFQFSEHLKWQNHYIFCVILESEKREILERTRARLTTNNKIIIWKSVEIIFVSMVVVVEWWILLWSI